ncbi:MAG: putative regulator of Ras-like GTPase activity (Roadblock/LC7/MglB family) [Candidatus Paceibacteria bacterium]|jgi:predicted regulator of Ras-like GTPase activity (Roadblock/LC7/MglB family)
MKRVLDPLARIAGVRRAVLFSQDGVPITHITRGDENTPDAEGRLIDSAEDLCSFAGLAAGLLGEIRRTVDPMSWEEPKRVVLKATRGTLVLLLLERANISVELERGMSSEELRLPMEAVVARLARATGRNSNSKKLQDEQSPSLEIEEPPGLFPAREETRGTLPESQSQAGNEVPNTNTEN